MPGVSTDRADAVTADTEGCVVDPLLLLHLEELLLLHLEEPGVAAGHPVVSPAPVPVGVHLAAGLTVDRPPVSTDQTVVLPGGSTDWSQPDWSTLIGPELPLSCLRQ